MRSLCERQQNDEEGWSPLYRTVGYPRFFRVVFLYVSL